MSHATPTDTPSPFPAVAFTGFGDVAGFLWLGAGPPGAAAASLRAARRGTSARANDTPAASAR